MISKSFPALTNLSGPAKGRPLTATASDALTAYAEFFRLDASRRLDPARRVELGQFLTPAPVAGLMASMVAAGHPTVRILDAGAGVGSLSAALIAELCNRSLRPRAIHLTTYELDPALIPYLSETLTQCKAACVQAGIAFTSEVCQEDFIAVGVGMLEGGMFAPPRQRFDAAILNPPYRKMHSASRERLLLRRIGVETSNLYTAFVALVVRLLEPGGELVAITPRSFCNGPYFRPFREEFLRTMRLRRLHVFASRNRAFADDDVLQENVILHAVKAPADPAPVTITTSSGPEDEDVSIREVAYDELVAPDDPQRFIRIVADGLGRDVAGRMNRLPATLAGLGLSVSTGRVVDFRAKPYLRDEPEANTAPLIYPGHFADGAIAWPKAIRKPNALALAPSTEDLLVPPGVYVLVKRFSAKEEPRRIVAAIYDAQHVSPSAVGFENHLNYFHVNGRGLPRALAYGLAAFLNSSLVDAYFRQFSGHTQVNATDLRTLPYPARSDLERLGERVGAQLLAQSALDELVEEELMANDGEGEGGGNPIRAQQKIDQALAILKDVGLPRGQQNERSALTLLALLDLRLETPWSEAGNPLRGITPIMEFMREHYGKTYAPNTRETVRRFTMHQFVQAGIAVENPDDPTRPTNSPDFVYQAEATFLELVRTYDAPGWEQNLRTYLAGVETLRQRFARERAMQRVPVTLADGTTFTLSPGGQNVLVPAIVTEFAPRFTPGAAVLYVGDTGEKFAHVDRQGLAALGVAIAEHGKMPDVVLHDRERNWLVLVEAVTSHGPVDPKRRQELRELFTGATAPLVFVTAFLTRQAMVRYLGEIAWETEVWVADAPSHLIHFNGERFLGPYE
jgi:adenine-specific DNA-methyltransferase